MTLVTVLGDGTTLPKLNNSLPIILLFKGAVSFGYFNDKKYRANVDYIDPPENQDLILEEIINYVYNDCMIMLHKRHPVHILCPFSIAKKMRLIAENSL